MRTTKQRHPKRGYYAVDVELMQPGHPETRQHTWQTVYAKGPREAELEIHKLYKKHHREQEVVRVHGTIFKGEQL